MGKKFHENHAFYHKSMKFGMLILEDIRITFKITGHQPSWSTSLEKEGVNIKVWPINSLIWSTHETVDTKTETL